MAVYGGELFFTIIREVEFDLQVKALCKKYRRMPELDEAIDWALSRKPHFFNHITDDYYLWVTEKLVNNDFPKLKILYKINDSERTVTLLSIEED